ncbi:MAG: hypothetical protein HYS13_19405 [Planctomycetia bacterium]|nr:hypothetical protein [Planctomycetia bacterium]
MASDETLECVESAMDERIARLTTPEECDRFARDVEVHLPEVAKEARLRGIELRTDVRAAALGVNGKVEREALRAIYAYEAALFKKHGKRVCASRTWQMVKKYGVIAAVERAVNRKTDAAGYLALVEMNLRELAFEEIVLRYPSHFSPDAVRRSQERLSKWQESSPHLSRN